MKHAFILVITQLPAIICVGAASYLAVNSLPNWGWFLGAAFVLRLGTSISFNEKTTKAEKRAER